MILRKLIGEDIDLTWHPGKGPLPVFHHQGVGQGNRPGTVYGLRHRQAEQWIHQCLQSGEISLLITDVVMPEMNGRELADQMKNHCPGIKCLFMSGYTADTTAHRGVVDEGIQFIQKAFFNQRPGR